MKAPKIKFSEWLIKKYKIKVKDIKDAKPPWLWRKLKNIGAIALKGKKVYIKDLDGMAEYKLWPILVHEIEHIQRQRKWGWLAYLVRYALRQSFRANDEVVAFTSTMEARHIRGHSITGLPSDISKILDKQYLLNRSKTRWAKKKLEANMQKILSGEIHTVKTLMKKWEKEQ